MDNTVDGSDGPAPGSVPDPASNSVPVAVVFVGVQAAGKSTYFAQRFADTHVRLNLDMLRTRHRERVLMHALLAIGQRFVVDNTNLTARARARYVQAAKAAGYRVEAVVFELPLELALARNAARTGRARVPDRAVRGSYAKLEAVTEAEGFDAVTLVDSTQPNSPSPTSETLP
nr:ATP-binding protein [Plesiocystis pacifica]